MPNGRDINYKTGRKNQWRNWAWKEVAKRVEDTSTAKVLYLAAAEDLDRVVAVRNGFHPDNLIAIDSDPEVVKRLRNKGAIAINGDILRCALLAAEYFDVIWADLCCGAEEKVFSFLNLISKLKRNRRQVLLLNLLRGRDRYIRKVRGDAMCEYLGGHEEKNRAKICSRYLVQLYSRDMLEGSERYDVKFTGEDGIFALANHDINPTFRSYKANGGRTSMDSCVLNVPIFPLQDFEIDTTHNKKDIQKITAAKAIRTMKIGGKLKASCRW